MLEETIMAYDSKENNLKSFDSKILRLLADNGRMTWAELGQRLECSAPTAAEHVRRLEEDGYIEGFAARLIPEKIGYSLTAFVSVVLDRPQRRTAFLKTLMKLDQVLEAHHVAGTEDYLLKVVALSTRDLDQFLSEILKSIPGVARTRTTIVLGTAKDIALKPPPQAKPASTPRM
jgi:Lrp/AsnC family leucine-responsive transcriptional regulator